MTAPTLNHLQEFTELLQNYQMSADSRELLAQARIGVLVGTTAAGRNTLIGAMNDQFPGVYHHLVSDTTRPPKLRNGVMERHGVEYFFRSEEDVLADVRAGHYVEAAVIHQQQVSGTNLSEIQRTVYEGKIALAEVTFHGAENIYAVKPDAKILFILPPDFDTWLGRVNRRGDLHGEEFKRRLTSALTEYDEALTKPYYQLFVNDDISRSATRLHRILTESEGEQAPASELRELVVRLREQTREYLADLG